MGRYYDLSEYLYKKFTWSVKVQWSNECLWINPEVSAGRCLVVGEENGFGKRRVRIIIKPDKHWNPKQTKSYYKAAAWVTEPRPKRPKKFKIHSVK